jgi:pyruvate dehydrogenase E2 component (dihydrolipoamide acetyltransferase)
MPVEIVMPRLSDTMETGTIARWLKKEGDEVKKGETLADVETDKATMPLESYATGRLAQVLLAEGQSAPIGTPIAVIATAGETIPAASVKPAAATPPAKTADKPKVAAADAAPAPTAEKSPVPSAEKTSAPAEPAAGKAGAAEGIVRASPIARRMAEELGIDLRAVNGSGPSGRVTREDVEEAARQAPVAAATSAPGATPATQRAGAAIDRPLSRIQQTIARRMVQSKTTVPHFYVTAEVDMAEATSLRTQLLEAWPDVRISYLDLIVKAVALALVANPAVNASWREDHLEFHEDVNVGLAVAIEGGLLVPVLHGVNRTDLRTLSKLSKELIERTRAGKSMSGDFEGGTFSVSNLGQFPVQNFLAIVNPPESGILAVSRIEKRPVARVDSIVLSDRMNVSLSGDHRVFYGFQAAEFMTKLKELLERPLSLLS